jgi:RNA polymerase-binding protein DksA
MPIPEAVPTNGKPRKNQAGLSSRELEHYRDLLLEKRRELVGDMYSMESEALRTSGGTNLSSLPLHMADMGTDNYEQEFTLGLVEKDRGLLREINSALAKIQNGTFGICEGTGKPIGKPRLEAQPWANTRSSTPARPSGRWASAWAGWGNIRARQCLRVDRRPACCARPLTSRPPVPCVPSMPRFRGSRGLTAVSRWIEGPSPVRRRLPPWASVPVVVRIVGLD